MESGFIIKWIHYKIYIKIMYYDSCLDSIDTKGNKEILKYIYESLRKIIKIFYFSTFEG